MWDDAVSDNKSSNMPEVDARKHGADPRDLYLLSNGMRDEGRGLWLCADWSQ